MNSSVVSFFAGSLPHNDYDTHIFEAVIPMGLREGSYFSQNVDIGSGKLWELLASRASDLLHGEVLLVALSSWF